MIIKSGITNVLEQAAHIKSRTVLLIPIQHRKQTYGSPFDRTELILIPIKQRIEIYGLPFGRTELILLPIQQRKEIYGSPFGRTEDSLGLS